MGVEKEGGAGEKEAKAKIWLSELPRRQFGRDEGKKGKKKKGGTRGLPIAMRASIEGRG